MKKIKLPSEEDLRKLATGDTVFYEQNGEIVREKFSYETGKKLFGRGKDIKEVWLH